MAQQVGLYSQVPLGSLNIDDPKLAEAYRYFFLSEEGRSGTVDSVPIDIRQRGMGSVNLLMRLFDENADNAVRDCILYWIDDFPNLPVDAFREKVRNLIQQDAGSLSRKDCVYFAEFLANHGTDTDIPLLEKLVAIDPNGEIGIFVGKYLKKLHTNLAQKTSNRKASITTSLPPTNIEGAKVTPPPMNSPGVTAPSAAKKSTKSAFWFTSGSALAIVVGLLMVWHRRKK
jgi:hypothetical protein